MIQDYSRRVRRSLLERDLLGGVPTAGIIILVILAAVFIAGFEIYFMIIPIAIFYFVMRFLTKKDPWMIDILLENIQQKDRFIP